MIDEHAALNKQQLAAALGVPKTWLWNQKLPFQGGRLSLADARRILRQRQDQMERDRIKGQPPPAQPVAESETDARIRRRVDEMFYGAKVRKR
jgi:hypothetical protein